MKNFAKLSAGVSIAALISTSALAAGFERGTADTDILYERGNAMRAGATIVAPSIDITGSRITPTAAGVVPPPANALVTPAIAAPGASGGYDSPDYVVPSFAIKMALTDELGCAGTYTTPFGGHTDYSSFSLNGVPLGFDPLSNTLTRSTQFKTHEFGFTCSYGFDVGPGRLHVIGGAFAQTLDYEQMSLAGSGRFRLEDRGYGYRVGIGYEIPEIALRAQLMYRSDVDVDAEGDFTKVGPTATGNALVDGAPIGTVLNPNATGVGTFPQSVELKLQSGIAPGWLAFGSIKWTEWSVFDTLNYVALGPNSLNFFYDDSWKVQMGIAHVFTEDWSGAASLTWDQGVGTGHDVAGDTWTLSLGALHKINDSAELRIGAAYIWVEGGTQTFIQDAAGNAVPFANAKVYDDGHAIAGNASITFKF